MTSNQGRRFSEQEIAKIRRFLAETDMTISDIATRMGCSKVPWRRSTGNSTFAITTANGPSGKWVQPLRLHRRPRRRTHSHPPLKPQLPSPN